MPCASSGSNGIGPLWAPWAVVGRALVGSPGLFWALWALVGRVGPPLWAGTDVLMHTSVASIGARGMVLATRGGGGWDGFSDALRP